ncbi:MAG TPA: hypothetical protein VMU50_00055 [Polyangia bacterium]|nr:hypothetical protein [Polyangia bacterium]
MGYFVEVAQVVNGQVASVKVLSDRRERREATLAVAACLAAFGAAFLLTSGAMSLFHRVVYGPVFLSLWMGIGALAAVQVGRRTRARARSYVVGADLAADAFAPVAMDLVSGARDGVGLTVTPGMTGRLFGSGREPVVLESLVQSGHATRVPIGPGARAEVRLLDGTRFIVTVSEAGASSPPGRHPLAFKPLVRPTLLAIEAAVLISMFCAVPTGATLTEADMRSSIPANATPWEVEKLLRHQAQLQARSLHQCFDVLPLSCQRPGYVGVGMALDRSGEIRSNWIARSTYGQDCPVDRCMSEVIARWFFEPLPETMRIILPVQVLRTERPLPDATSLASAPRARHVCAGIH